MCIFIYQVLFTFEATEVSHCLQNVYRTWDYSGLQHWYLFCFFTKRIISLYITPCYIFFRTSFEMVMYVNNICCEKCSCVTEFKTFVSSSVLLCKVRFVVLFCNQYCPSMNSLHRLKINSELSDGICIDTDQGVLPYCQVARGQRLSLL